MVYLKILWCGAFNFEHFTRRAKVGSSGHDLGWLGSCSHRRRFPHPLQSFSALLRAYDHFRKSPYFKTYNPLEAVCKDLLKITQQS
jgi:hypothetical protein